MDVVSVENSEAVDTMLHLRLCFSGSAQDFLHQIDCLLAVIGVKVRNQRFKNLNGILGRSAVLSALLQLGCDSCPFLVIGAVQFEDVQIVLSQSVESFDLLGVPCIVGLNLVNHIQKCADSGRKLGVLSFLSTH